MNNLSSKIKEIHIGSFMYIYQKSVAMPKQGSPNFSPGTVATATSGRPRWLFISETAVCNVMHSFSSTFRPIPALILEEIWWQNYKDALASNWKQG